MISVFIFTVLNSVSCYCYCAVGLFCFCFCHFTGWIIYQEVISSYQSYLDQLFLCSCYRSSTSSITWDNLPTWKNKFHTQRKFGNCLLINFKTVKKNKPGKKVKINLFIFVFFYKLDTFEIRCNMYMHLRLHSTINFDNNVPRFSQ